MLPQYAGVALITNAGNALGLAVMRGFIEAGCTRIIVSTNSLDSLRRLKAAIEELALSADMIHGVQHNTEGDEGWENMVRAASDVFGDIDYYVNCSELTPALASPKPTLDLEPSVFSAALRDTSRELWLCCRAQLRQCTSQLAGRKARTIVNIIPYGNFGTHPGHPVLAASSYGRIGMTKTFAKDHLGSGIRINAVCHALTRSQADDAPVLREHAEATGRLITEAEVAKAVLFLAGDGSSGMAGVAMPVDGGWSLVHN
ncbi:hypothetical protein FB567DRAFT_584122 [Paraphoma chrysanthemicola]|uniref:NAD(P)-binding protein n=1 Tax=Paraphoma chrysanthemicola TaxID=798071 RepID=A0A8K0QUN4_9PLEO|nr:hypothetical protein FB567DRAFT_584122 [Paraphoma chrysanthemicola]